MLQHFSELIDKVKAMPRTVVCVANADSETVEAARMALDEGLADVILYGDEAVVRPLVGQAGIEGRVELRHAADPATALREAVRSVRCGESGVLMKGMLNSSDFLRGVLFDGGDVDKAAILRVSADGGAGLAELYAPTTLAEAGAAGSDILKSGAMTEFEKLCDDAVSGYLSAAQFVPFGEAPLIGYLAARETEYTNLRILLLGRGAGLAPELIRARLRRSYV